MKKKKPAFVSQTTVSKVLIVDDAQVMRRVLKDIIQSNNLSSNVVEAGDGVEAVRTFINEKPDLVTLDVNMPNADGIQALRAIMKVDPTAKVVMVTSVEQKQIIDEAVKYGACDYMIKPFNRSHVPLVLSKVIRQKVNSMVK